MFDNESFDVFNVFFKSLIRNCDRRNIFVCTNYSFSGNVLSTKTIIFIKCL